MKDTDNKNLFIAIGVVVAIAIVCIFGAKFFFKGDATEETKYDKSAENTVISYINSNATMGDISEFKTATDIDNSDVVAFNLTATQKACIQTRQYLENTMDASCDTLSYTDVPWHSYIHYSQFPEKIKIKEHKYKDDVVRVYVDIKLRINMITPIDPEGKYGYELQTSTHNIQDLPIDIKKGKHGWRVVKSVDTDRGAKNFFATWTGSGGVDFIDDNVKTVQVIKNHTDEVELSKLKLPKQDEETKENETDKETTKDGVN